MNVSFNLPYEAYHTQVPFGRYAVFRKACFTGQYDTGNSIPAAENTFFFFRKMEKKTYRIIIRPARPRNTKLVIFEAPLPIESPLPGQTMLAYEYEYLRV